MDILLSSLSIIPAIFLMSKVIRLKQVPLKLGKSKNGALLSLIIVAITMYIVNPLILILLRKYFSGAEGLLRVVLTLIFPIVLLLPISFALWLRKESINTLGLTSLNTVTSALIGLVCSFVFMVTLMMVNHTYITFGLDDAWWLLYWCIVGLTEEIIFRGYVQSRLIAWIGKPKGLIFSSVFFCTVHLPQRIIVDGFGVIEAAKSSFSLLIVAIALGYIMIKTENIIAPTILHTFINWSQDLLIK